MCTTHTTSCTGPCDPITVVDCHLSDGQLLLLPGGNESTSPSPLILLFQLSHPPGLEHGTISGRPSSWVMCSNSEPKPLSLHPQNTLLSSPLGPVSAYVAELWARAQALSSFPVQELPKARPAGQQVSWQRLLLL